MGKKPTHNKHRLFFVYAVLPNLDINILYHRYQAMFIY